MYDFLKTSDSCIKCGKCIQVCTIHDVNRDEVTSPRGFLDLLGAYQREDLELDKNTKNIFESCFLCTNCVDICPNSLAVDTSIEQIRYKLAQKFGITWYKKLVFIIMKHRKLMDFLAKIGWVFQSCGFKIKADIESMQPRFPMPIIKKERLLPNIKSKTFLNKYDDFIDNGGEKKVGIFIGCLANYTYTNIGDSLIEIFKVLKIDVYTLKDQKCCGAPAYFTGDFSSVEYLAKKNIEYFEKELEKLDAIVVPEATCCAMLKVDYEHFFHDDEEWRQRAKKISEKIYMATEYLANFTNLDTILQNKKKKEQVITYHDPCHSRKMLGIFKEPRALIGQNYDIKEMSNPNQCCGFGGVTMQTQKYHLSRDVGLKKAKMINDTSANIISAECSACRMQITNALNIENSKVVFKSPVELIAEALR